MVINLSFIESHAVQFQDIEDINTFVEDILIVLISRLAFTSKLIDVLSPPN